MPKQYSDVFKDELCSLVSKGMGTKAASEKAGITQTMVARWCNARNVPLPSHHNHSKVLMDAICKEVASDALNVPAASKKYKVSTGIIRRACNERGISCKGWRGRPVPSSVHIKAVELWAGGGMTREDIAQEIGASASQVGVWIKKAGIDPAYTFLTADLIKDMKKARPIQDLFTNWKRSKDLFAYSPEAA